MTDSDRHHHYFQAFPEKEKMANPCLAVAALALDGEMFLAGYKRYRPHGLEGFDEVEQNSLSPTVFTGMVSLQISRQSKKQNLKVHEKLISFK